MVIDKADSEHVCKQTENSKYKSKCQPSKQRQAEMQTMEIKKSTTLPLLLRRLHDLHLLRLANGRCRQTKPTPPLITHSQPKTPPIHCRRRKRTRAISKGCPSDRKHRLSIPPIPLLNQLPRNNPKNLINALPILGTNLMTTIPPDLLSPERRAALGIRTLQRTCPRRRRTPEHTGPESKAHSRRRRRRSSGRIKLLRDIGNSPLERNTSRAGIQRNDIGFCAHNVYHERLVALADIPPQLAQPARHLSETVLVGDIIAEETGVRATVIKTRNRAKAFLASRIPNLKTDGGVGGRIEDAFRDERRADGRCCSSGSESVANVSMDEGGFADS